MKQDLDRRVTQIVCIIVLVILAINMGVYYQIGVDASEQPPLTAGLTPKVEGWAAMSAAFVERVREAHPIGSNIANLTADLAGQGFKSKNWGIAPGQIGVAYRDEGNWVCKLGAEVRWSVDDNGRVKAITGNYGEHGCL